MSRVKILVRVAIVLAALPLLWFAALLVYYFAANAVYVVWKTEEVVELAMRWSFEEPAREASGNRTIVLEYLEFPDVYERVRGSELEEHLADFETDTVLVTFVVTKLFGRTRSYRITKVGDLDWPRFEHVGGMRMGPPGPSPFGGQFRESAGIQAPP